MPIESRIEPLLDLTIHIVHGRATRGEMWGALEVVHEGTPTRLRLWDMTAADVAGVDSGTMREFVARAAELSRERRSGKTAIVAPRDLQFGMARMAAVFTELESAPFEFAVFRTRDEAMGWLVEADGKLPD